MDPNLVKAVPVMTEHDRQADSRAGVTAAICGFISLSLLVVCTIFMYTSLEQRITLTTLEVFHDWLGLQNVFRETASYDPRFNLPSLDYYSTFDGASVSLPLLQDLETRGLLAGSQFTNLSRFFDPATGLPLTGLVDSRQLAVLFGDFVSKFYGKTFFNVSTQYLVASVSVNSSHMVDPRILVRLQRVSGCSFPDAVTGTTPNTRSPGCQCIANAYLHFVRATANTTGDVPMTSRNHAAEQVIRCMDQRVTTRAWAAGSAWTVHPVALAFYSNAIIFLICSAFILSLYHNDLFPMEWDATMRTHVIQGILVCLTGGLVFILMFHAPLGNGLQALGLILSLSTLIFSAHGVLGYPFRSDMTQLSMDPEPHPLMVCFWLNIPLLLPGPVIAVAIAGYTRDVYATWALAFVAAVLGILYMRLFWHVWNGDHNHAHKIFTDAMTLAIVDIFFLLFYWLWGHYRSHSVYWMSSFWVLAILTVWVFFVGANMSYDFHIFTEHEMGVKDYVKHLHQRFEDGEHAFLFFFTSGFLAFITVVACVDSHKT